MKPLTFEDVANLPAAYGVDPDFAEYVDYYGATLKQSALQAYVVFLYNGFYVSNIFNHTLWGCVGFIILVAMILRAFKHFSSPNTKLPVIIKTVRDVLVKHLYFSRTVGRATMVSKSWTSLHVPTRIHGILVGIYVAANCIIIFTPYKTLVPNVYWQDLGYTFHQNLRGLSDRTAILSFGSTPLVILLSGRNSPISTLTGANYSTLQIYHRWVARVVFMNALFHALGFTVNEILYSYEEYFASFQLPYWNYGIVAIFGGGLLVFLSMRRIREIAYEVFLIGHIIGAILWVVGCYYHVYFLDPDYYLLKYIYASMAIWAFDRVVRFLIIAYLNAPILRKHQSKPFAAEGYVIRTGDFIRIRIASARAWPASFGGPGTYVFISSPELKQIWQNHPFTITWPMSMPNSAETSTASSSEDLKIAEGKPFESAESAFESSALEDLATSFELVIKVYAGFTKTLANALTSERNLGTEQGDSGLHKFKLLVEGPYGTTVHLQKHSSILLICGGSGVASTIAHLADLAKNRGNVGKVVVVWAIRDPSACDVFAPYFQRLQQLFSNAPAGFMTLHIHVTAKKSEISEKATNDENTHSNDLTEISNRLKVTTLIASVNIHVGRPDAQQYLDNLISQTEADVEMSSIAISACGPLGLCDCAREAVTARLGKVADNILLDYYEETFTW